MTKWCLDCTLSTTRVRPNIVRKLVSSFNVTQQRQRHWELLSELPAGPLRSFQLLIHLDLDKASLAVHQNLLTFSHGSQVWLWQRGCGLEEAPPLTLKLFESPLQLAVVEHCLTWQTGAESPDWAAMRRAGTTESQRGIGGVIRGGEEGAQEALELHEWMMLSRWVHVEEDCEGFQSEETYFKVSG